MLVDFCYFFLISFDANRLHYGDGYAIAGGNTL
jgi:hypothetical protein